MPKTSQLKRTGNKVLLKGGALEDAIAAAITAMNEPKTCSTTILRRYLLDANKDRKQYQLGERRGWGWVRYHLLSTGGAGRSPEGGFRRGGPVVVAEPLRMSRSGLQWPT